MTTRGVGLSEEEREALGKARMTPYEDGKGGWLFRSATLDELAAVVEKIVAAHTADLAAQVARVKALADALESSGAVYFERDRLLADVRAALSPAQPDTEGE